MSFAHSHNFTIDRSALYNIEGDYYHSTVAPGERGIAELFRASCPDAPHDSQARHPPPCCLPGTRVALLEKIFDWIGKSDHGILWIHGPAGTGKSAIAQTAAEACAKNLTLAASFFFHGAPGRNAAERLVPSIAFQIATRVPEKRVQIGNLVEEDLSILHKPMDIQFKKLILPLFVSAPPNKIRANMISAHPRLPYVVIIDGLDECKGDNNQRDVVRHIGNLTHLNDIPLRFVVVSRPEPQIEESFRCLVIPSYNISLGDRSYSSQARSDIRTYLRHGFDQIYQKRHHDISTEHFWPSEDTMSMLVKKAEGAFVYASTVLKYIDNADFYPEDRLREILDTPPGLAPFAQLDHLYRRILGASPNPKHLLQVLTIISLFNQSVSPAHEQNKIRLCSLNTGDMEVFLRLRQGAVAMVLRRMHSIVKAPGSTYASFWHKSFPDFLHNKERAGEFFIDVQEGNAFIAQRLLKFIRHATRTNHLPQTSLFDFATDLWPMYCETSGGWDKHPHLLEEISKTLDSYPPLIKWGGPLPTRRMADFFQWLELEQTRPAVLKYPPLDIQYRLFKSWWKHHLNIFQPEPCSIFTFYTYINPELLLGDRFSDPTILSSPRLIIVQDLSSNNAIHIHDCQMFVSKVERPYDRVDSDWYLPEDLHHLLKMILHEPGCLEEYKMDIAKGHTMVFSQCLHIICKLYLSPNQEEYAYARKYWTSHLLNVPAGNVDTLEALQTFPGQRRSVVGTLTADETKAVRIWLKSSGVTPYGAWRVSAEETVHI